ncbi:PD-(D/E)XK nuclease domain-containing protein [Lachnospiraceae bacterium ZAX-1]
MLFFLILRKSVDYKATLEYKVQSSEAGVANGYADLVYTPYLKSLATYLFEFKYISTARQAKEQAIFEQSVSTAKAQLTQYGKGFLNAKCVAIVFVGKTCKHQELWDC